MIVQYCNTCKGKLHAFQIVYRSCLSVHNTVRKGNTVEGRADNSMEYNSMESFIKA